MFSRTKIARATAWAALLMSMTTVVHSAIVFSSRDHLKTVTFSDLTFADAAQLQLNVLSGSGALGDYFVYGDLQGLGTSWVGVTGTGGFAAAVVTPYVDGGSNAIGQFSVEVAGPSLNGAVELITARALTSSVSGGLHVLDVTGNTFGYVQPGGTVNTTVILPGNWSNIGTATGNAQLLSINSSWSVTQMFYYNSLTDTTTFQAQNTSYDGSSMANIQIRLYGAEAAVPLPAAAWFLLSGLGALPVIMRRRRSALQPPAPTAM